VTIDNQNESSWRRSTVLVAVLVMVVAACGSSDADPAAVLADYQEARNSGDVDAVMAFYAEDAVVEDHPLDSDGVATGVLEIRGFEGQVPRIQGTTGGIEYTDIAVSGNTVTFNTTFFNGDGDCFGAAGLVVTVEEEKITRWVYGPGDPSQCE